jgi:hypothetical protein
MTGDQTMPRGFVGRFLGSWRLAIGELVIVTLGVLLALWADQAMQARQDAARAVGYLERLQEDVAADIRSLRFSRDQARNRLAITRQVDAWLNATDAEPDPDSLVMAVHFAGVLFPPTISRFTIEELKSTGDLGLLENERLKRQVADYYNQIALQIDQWSSWGDVGITETYFREIAFVLDPEPRLRAGAFDPALMRRFLSASGGDGPGNYSEVQGDAPKIGATRAEADQILRRMRTRPNFEGYLRDSMYWAQLSALLLEGVILSAEELQATIAEELNAMRRAGPNP